MSHARVQAKESAKQKDPKETQKSADKPKPDAKRHVTQPLQGAIGPAESF